MAFASSVAWEVRTTGSDTNGGGFDAVSGSPGTDYSAQDSAQVTYTDLVIDGTTNTKCTSAGNPFTSAHVGNIINVTSGTGFTAQRVQIMSVSGSTATCDKSLGTLSSTGGNGKLGGALATPGLAAGQSAASNKIWIKAGSYTITGTTPNVAGGIASFAGGTAALPQSIEGYQTTRGDKGTRPVIDDGGLGGGGGVNVFTLGAAFTFVDNVSGSGSNANNVLFYVNAASCRVMRGKATGAADGFYVGTSGVYSSLLFCEGVSTNNSFIFLASCNVVGCTSHGSTVDGFYVATSTNGVVFDTCIAYANGGKGFNSSVALQVAFTNCDAYGNTGDGFSLSSSGAAVATYALNCLAVSNGGYGFSSASASGIAPLLNCATYSNSGGATNNLTNTEGMVVLTGDPFVNAAGGNFGLNSTAGAGAACRAAGAPGTFPGGLTANHIDIGAAQHADPSGGGLILQRSMTGGLV